MPLKFISSVLFVKDIQAARHFYEDLLQQKVENDFGLSIGYVGGFSIWQGEHAYQSIFAASADGALPFGRQNAELCFETEDVEALCAALAQANVAFVHPVHEQGWGQRVFRVYDPDGHILEIGEPMTAVIRRLLSLGKSIDEVTRQTAMPREIVEAIAAIT